MEKVTLPVRLFKLLGVELLVGKRAKAILCVWMDANIRQQRMRAVA